MGVTKSERDYCGRWSPEGSDGYARSFRAVVGRLQSLVAEEIRAGRAYLTFDESAIGAELGAWLRERRGMSDAAAEDLAADTMT
eukprot:3245959-Lingulodinium_polyedra.AAC.1